MVGYREGGKNILVVWLSGEVWFLLVRYLPTASHRRPRPPFPPPSPGERRAGGHHGALPVGSRKRRRRRRGRCRDTWPRSPGDLLVPALPRRRPSSRAGCRQLAPPPCEERVSRPGDAGNVVHMLRSAAAADPEEALELFLSVARQPRVLHTTESCNYMLELMRAHGRVGDGPRCSTQCRGRSSRPMWAPSAPSSGGRRRGASGAPVALPVMKEAGIVLNAYTYNGLIYFLVKSGFTGRPWMCKAMADGGVSTVRPTLC
ncbi:hypothetical protein ZWY2020_051618 [Hordeum vulgare]|nr:hypothetical protein ZWY2020_051618 [Hordeum vulgare]